jgi:hypothetical protein
MPQVTAIVPDQGGVDAGHNTTVAIIAKYRLVKRGTTTKAITPAVDGLDAYVGVTMAAIPIGAAGDVQIARRALVECGAAVPIGSKVMGSAGGKGIVATAAKYAIGTANTAALVDGDIIECDIDRIALPA